MKSDPFAPADDPFHIKNLEAARSEQFAGKNADRFVELVKLHVTDHEENVNSTPQLEELERRQTLVDEYREQLAVEGPDAEAPTLEDETGALYKWREGDRVDDVHPDDDDQPDGATSSRWVFIGEADEGDPADSLQAPPRNGPGSSTEVWREFAAAATLTEPAGWATMSRDEIVHKLQTDGVIPSEQG